MEEIMKSEKNIDTNVSNKLKKIMKRLIDIIGGFFGSILLIPVTIGIIITKIIVKEKGSIFYSQYRIGKNGKLFKIYKYRSMIVDADEKLNEYLSQDEKIREEYKKYKKLKDDPRITKIGKFIRRTNIDEIPQFINVLKGDMSLVGPRPYLQQEIEEMGEYYNKIISCKPGITGIWQINSDTKREFNERLELEANYINTNTLKNDIKILLKTVMLLRKKKQIN